MREFLKPLRRKVGVVTLLVACVLMAGWISSLNGVDIIGFGKGEETYSLRSINGRIEWHRDTFNMRIGDHRKSVRWDRMSFDQYFIVARMEVAFAAQFEPVLVLFMVHYWMLVLPLTLLSAWLLLRKPRPAKKSERFRSWENDMGEFRPMPSDNIYRLLKFVLGVTLFLAVLAVVQTYSELYELVPEWQREHQLSTPKPEELSLRQWLERGADSNPHVKLTNLVFCRDYTRITRKGDGRSFIHCVPVVPREDVIAGVSEPMPRGVRLVVVSSSFEDIADVRRLTEVSGVIGHFKSLSKHDEDALLAAYPDTDPKQCRVLYYRREPVTARQIEDTRARCRVLLPASGAVAALALAGLLALKWYGRR